MFLYLFLLLALAMLVYSVAGPSLLVMLLLSRLLGGAIYERYSYLLSLAGFVTVSAIAMDAFFVQQMARASG